MDKFVLNVTLQACTFPFTPLGNQHEIDKLYISVHTFVKSTSHVNGQAHGEIDKICEIDKFVQFTLRILEN